MRRFKLNQYLHEILLSLRPKLKLHNVNVSVECDENLTIDSLPGAYSQIITNLVINSLTHAFSPADSGTIRISAQQQASTLMLEYHDDGVGMNAQVKAHVFDPFFTTRRGQGGSGLGMNIVYNLITQKLGGKLQLESEPGAGMHLRFSVPLNATETETPSAL